MKKYFYLWAFLDLEKTGKIRDTYLYNNSKEVSGKNLKMVKSITVILCIFSVLIMAISLFYFHWPKLAYIYMIIFGIEAVICFISEMIRKKESVIGSNILAAFFLFHMLVVGSVIGTVYSPDESAVIFIAMLPVAQILFIFPPLVTSLIQGAAIVITLVLSCQIKTQYFFESDILNCFGAFAFSILLGWYITKVRIEEMDARNKAIYLTDELRALSVTDQLTTLQNHRSFQETYYSLFEKYSQSGQKLGIIMLDIDKFKNYNDNYGHIEGDKCLNGIGKCIAAFKSETVQPFRFGGEEFVIILTDDACNHIADIAEQIRRKVEELAIRNAYSKISKVVTISAGYYVGTPREIAMPMSLVDYADQALYQSKEAGGNTVIGTY